MKGRITVWVAVMVFVTTGASAQGIKIGVKGGASMYQLQGMSLNNQFKWGYQAGGTAELMWSKNWGIQPEVVFNQSNLQTGYNFDTLYKSINPGTLKSMKLNYLSLPVLLNWRPSPLITFQAGPQFSILMSKDRTLLQDGSEAVRHGNLAMVGGVQLNILSFRFYGRYVMGLTNLNNIDPNEQWKSRGFQFGAGFVF